VHVNAALASLRAETHRNLEIIVVDDGGAFRGKRLGPDVRIVEGDSLGVGRARNLGLTAAQGEFVIFLDDDDVAMPNRIASLLNAAESTEAGICFGMTRRVAVGTSMALASVPTNVTAEGPVGFRDLLACNPHVNSVLVRTETLRAAGGFDVEADHFDDWSAWLRIADGQAVVRRIDDVVAEWRLHAHGLSAHLLKIRAMKARLIALFDRLEPCLSAENARAVALARAVVAGSDIRTYDDYAAAMARSRTAAGEEPRRPLADSGR
jgi:glycosyltransferase involved in cell wall biosynthesis